MNIKKLIIFFLLTRLLLVLVGLYVRFDDPYLKRGFDFEDEQVYFGKIGTIFHGSDSAWYLDIAKYGYPKVGLAYLERNTTSIVFFPLYPLIIRTLSLFVNNVFSAVLISNTCFFVSSLILYHIIKNKFNENIAFETVKYLFIFPTSFIFSSIQSESLFLSLLLLAFYFLEKNKFLYVGIAGFLLSLTRPEGILISIPLGYKLLNKIQSGEIRNRFKSLIVATLPLLGLALYILYLYLLTGSFNAFFVAQRPWEQGISLNIFNALILIKGAIVNDIYSFFNIFIALVMILLSFCGSYLLGVNYILMTSVYVLIHLSTLTVEWHIMSFSRYFSVLFPAYLGLAKLEGVNKFTRFILPCVLIVLQVIMFYYWTRGFPIPQ